MNNSQWNKALDPVDEFSENPSPDRKTNNESPGVMSNFQKVAMSAANSVGTPESVQ